MSDTVLDVKGMRCPLPVLRANRALRSLAPGARLRVLATDRASVADFRAFCQETGHALLAQGEEAGVFSFTIRKREDAPLTVALFTHPACLGHDTGAGHPERPERLRRVLQALEHPDFVPLIRQLAPQATVEQLCLAHPARHVEAILAVQPAEGGYAHLDGDTLMSAGSREAALRSAGAGVAAVDAVMEGWAQAAFAAVRPPGHHAERATAMGFCLFAGASIAALHARARWGLTRVAVVDFDVHHGNGTQHILEADADMLYVSSHQSPCYPGTGAASERGVADNVVNLPLRPGTGSAGFRQAWEALALPRLAAFAPELLIISAGFDAHKADPLAELRLETEDFAWITDRLLEVADRCCPGRVVSILEGGYDVDALAASAALHVRRLMRQ